MQRRSFLRVASAALGGAATLGAVACRAGESSGVVSRIGVQLYTVRDLLSHDFYGVLREIRRIGYEEVEFAGLHGQDPREIRALLDDVGLVAPAGHVGLDALRGGLDAEVELARALGHAYLVVPWIDAAERTSLDGYHRIAAELNEIGERVRAAGLQLAYHNHDFEFETFGGRLSGYDVLLAETDPDLVALEMDLYWAVHGGGDPVAYFEQHPGRFPLVHVKDRAADGSMAEVGAGTIDFARVFAHAEQAGIRHAFVEHDQPQDPLQSIRASYAYLARLVRQPHQKP